MTGSNVERVATVPWIVGLYGLAGTAFVEGARMADWFGSAESAAYLFPFIVLFGLLQLLAAMGAYEARDELAAVVLGTWGAFWIAYGIQQNLLAWGKLSTPVGAFLELAFWFVVLAAITWVGAVAATGRNMALVAVVVFLAAASTVGALGEGLGSERFVLMAGWMFVIGAVCAAYAASALMFEATFGHEVLPIGYARGTGQHAGLREASVSRRAG